MSSLEFVLGLLDSTFPAFVAWEDFTGPHGGALRLLQRMGFIGEPGMNPVLSCPYCREGEPERIGWCFLCSYCHSTVDQRHLQLWPLSHDALLCWLASELKLQGGVRQISGQVWQLGSGQVHGTRHEWFYRRSGALTEAEQSRLAAYRNLVVLYGTSRLGTGSDGSGYLSLLEALNLGEALTVADPSRLLEARGVVRFDAATGTLWAGDSRLGEVPVGSKECTFLACLAQRPDAFVPYADIKQYVVSSTGSEDTTDEATFCQKLKSRIKKKWIPQIDRAVVVSSKADGYRLRAVAEL